MKTGGETAGTPPGVFGTGADRRREILQAVRRHGRLTVAGIALQTSLSVKQANETLSGLAGEGRVEIQMERGRLLYSLRKDRG